MKLGIFSFYSLKTENLSWNDEEFALISRFSNYVIVQVAFMEISGPYMITKYYKLGWIFAFLGIPDRVNFRYTKFTAKSVYDKMMFMVEIHPFVKRKTIDEYKTMISLPEMIKFILLYVAGNLIYGWSYLFCRFCQRQDFMDYRKFPFD